MSTAPFLHGPHDARVALFNPQEGRLGKIMPCRHFRPLGSELPLPRDGIIGAGSDVGQAAARTGSSGPPLIVSDSSTPNGCRDAARAASPSGRLVLAGIPDDESRTVPAPATCRRDLGTKLPRRMEAILLKEGCCHGKKPLRH